MAHAIHLFSAVLHHIFPFFINRPDIRVGKLGVVVSSLQLPCGGCILVQVHQQGATCLRSCESFCHRDKALKHRSAHFYLTGELATLARCKIFA